MLVGYARTSTVEQRAGFDAQLRDLKAAGCEKTFHEQVSSVAERVELERAIDYIRDTDKLIVTKLDRFARSIANAVELERRIAAKGATLKILDPRVDTSTAAGRLTFNLSLRSRSLSARSCLSGSAKVSRRQRPRGCTRAASLQFACRRTRSND
jgi:DNA invertase Pin-like site-specific DNA recombinase